ncbi:secretory phospholipase A2 [Coleophoma cylindrospora]|uniref:Secretory phospholipase A2 n=1 Tax=Coleophoma cylindrospora TaxID=1849047 RepID=A0A3D8QNE7_9HELO|nr:secretory phospholipase A2 [Coleophoma cylindrospora]
MKFTSIVLFSLSTIALAAPLEEAAKPPARVRATACTTALTDKLLFSTGINAFSAARDDKNPSCFDWSSNDCSKSPDRPAGFDFIPSCQRHDFGYQNMRAQSRLTEANRKRIDDNFKTDMYNECKKYHGWEAYKGVKCRRIADVYYLAVRRCGDGDCFDK